MWLLYYSIQQKSVRYYSPFNINVWKKTNGDRNYLNNRNLLNFCCSGHGFLVVVGATRIILPCPTFREEREEGLHRRAGVAFVRKFPGHEEESYVWDVARLNRVETIDKQLKFGEWDSHASRAVMRDDLLGYPFAVLDFQAFPRAWKEPATGSLFYEPFFGSFKVYRSLALFEPNVWLWIVEQEKSSAVVALYHEKMSTEYNLYHNTYIPAKTEGIAVLQEAAGVVKQHKTLNLYFLTHKNFPSGRLPIKANAVLRKIYSLPTPQTKELMEETLYAIYLQLELRLDFYVGILKILCMTGDTIYNVFGVTKLMYAALVSVSPT